MNDPPRRRLLDKAGATSLLAAEVHVTGELETAGGLMVCGSVQGNGRIGSEFNLAAGARWEGHVHTRRAVINGELVGSLLVEEKLEIGATAVIRGQITAKQLAIARGATIDGEMVVTGSEPAIEFEEKRSGI